MNLTKASEKELMNYHAGSGFMFSKAIELTEDQVKTLGNYAKTERNNTTQPQQPTETTPGNRQIGRESKMRKYMPVGIDGTSGACHLNYEIEELMPEAGYASAAGAARGWYRACRRANAYRRKIGYTIFARPLCRVEIIE